MEAKEEINDSFEDTDELEELLDVDNVEVVPPDHCDIISMGEESVIEECLNDTDASLSSVNLDFFNDDKPIKGRRKKTMEKRKEERMSFKHVAAKATASDNEDDEDFNSRSSIWSVDSVYWKQIALELKQLKDDIDLINKKSESTVEGNKILDSNNAEEINQLKITLHTPKCDKEREQEKLLIHDNIKIGVKKDYYDLKVSKNYKDDKPKSEKQINDVTDEILEQEPSNMDLKLLSMNKSRNVLEDRRRRRLISPKSDNEEKSNKEFQNIETNEAIGDEEPSTSKNANVTNKRVRVGGLKSLLISECDEKKGELYSNDEIVPTSSKNSNMERKVVRRKRRVSAKRQEVAKNAHIYSFFSSMADLVSTLPYPVTLTAKARVTKMLEEIVARVTKPQDDRSPQAITCYEISEEDLKLIKLRLSKLPYIY